MTAKIILSGYCGPHYAVRHFLTVGESNYWNDDTKSWTNDSKAKTLWANEDEAIQRQYELMIEQVPGTLHRFVAPNPNQCKVGKAS